MTRHLCPDDFGALHHVLTLPVIRADITGYRELSEDQQAGGATGNELATDPGHKAGI